MDHSSVLGSGQHSSFTLSFTLSGTVAGTPPSTVASGYTISTVAGDGTLGFSGDGGPGTLAELSVPFGVAVDGAGNLFIADFGNSRLRKVTPANAITTVAGNGTIGFSGDGGPATSAQLFSPEGVAVDGAGNLFIADLLDNRIRKVTPAGTITTVAGNGTLGFSGDGGPGTSAELASPTGVAVDGAGNLFIADFLNNRIRKVTPAGIITTVAGNGTIGFSGDGGPGTSAQLFLPEGVAVDGAGNLFIADSGNNSIRKVTPAGTITTVAGNGTLGFSGDGGPATLAELDSPVGVAVDGAGNLFIADSENNLIRKITPAGTITTVAGNGTRGFSGDGGPGTSAELASPSGVAVDRAGNLFIAEWRNNRVRKLTPIAVQPGVVPNPQPNIVNLSPSSALAGSGATTVIVSGSGFIASSTATFNGVSHAASLLINTKQLTITLSTSDLTAAGSFPVVVTNPAPGGGASNSVSFTVQQNMQPAATLASINPSSGAVGTILTVVIAGVNTNFVQGQTLATFGPGISVGGSPFGQAGTVTVSSPTSATAQVTIDPSAALGARTVTVATGAQTASLNSAFTVLAPPAPLGPLSITSTLPGNGDTNVSMTPSIQITFNEPLDPATIGPSTFTLANSRSMLPATVTIDSTGEVVTLTPSGVLTPNATYSVMIDAQVRNAAESPLGNPFSFSFTVVPTATVAGTVTGPSGLDPTSLRVFSFGGNVTMPDSTGNFSASLNPAGWQPRGCNVSRKTVWASDNDNRPGARKFHRRSLKLAKCPGTRS